jgi:hypothetical protein
VDDTSRAVLIIDSDVRLLGKFYHCATCLGFQKVLLYFSGIKLSDRDLLL